MIGGRDLKLMLADPRSGLVVTPILDADEQIGDAGIDIRLGPDIIVSKRATGTTAFDASNPKAFREARRLRQEYVRRGIGDPFHLQPGEFVIARSLEYVSLPDGVSAEALGRSSWGRLGLTIATATHVEPGFHGTITLELANVGNTPLVLLVGLRVAQLVFSRDQPQPVDAEVQDEAARLVAARPQPSVAVNPGPPLAEQQRRRRVDRQKKMLAWDEGYRVRRRHGRYEGQLKPAGSRLDEDRDLAWVAPMSISFIIGVVGERFAGKSTVVDILVAGRHLRLYRLGAHLFEEAQRRGQEPNRMIMAALGTELRLRHADDAILAKIAYDRMRTDHLDPDRRRQPVGIVVEGFRVADELKALQRLDSFYTMVVKTDDTHRVQRADRSGALEPEKTKFDDPFPEALVDQVAWVHKHIDSDQQLRGLLAQSATEKVITVENNSLGLIGLRHRLDEVLIEREANWRRRPY